jgi:hypothetical protein
VAAILKFLLQEGVVFDDNVTAIMRRAFDMAMVELHDTGQPDLVKEVIAKRIIETAVRGERAPVRLCEAVMGSLGFRRKAI